MGNFYDRGFMDIKEELMKAQLIAKSFEGELLTKEYINSKTKMLWQCSNSNHPSFLKTLQKVKLSQWCQYCAKEGNKKIFNKDIIDNINNNKINEIKILLENTATLLSTEYKSLNASFEVECNKCKGINKTNFEAILNKEYNCVHCFSVKNKGLLKAKELASAMSGTLISKIYMGNKDKLEWKCANEKHLSFFLSYNKVSSAKQWCPECKVEDILREKEIRKKEKLINKINIKQTKSLMEIRKLNFSKIKNKLKNQNILIKDEIFKNQNQRVSLICNICANEWSVVASSISKGIKGCTICNPKKYILKTKNKRANKDLRINVENKLKELGGEVLEYLPLGVGRFKCGVKDHKSWATKIKYIVDGSWCKECNFEHKRKTNRDNINILALRKNGTCLNANIYKNNKTLLKWKCSNEEHSSWNASYHTINTLGSWCPECATNNKSENRTREMLEYLLGYKFEKSYPEWLINDLTERQMELDGFNVENKIAFEFQGEQHYKLCGWNNENSLKELQYRDELKKKLCKDNNVILLIIYESSKTKRWSGLLEEIVKSLNEKNVEYRKDIDQEKLKNIFNKY
jgi:hypothetical protein